MRIIYYFPLLFLFACSTGGTVEVGGVPVQAGVRAAADGQTFDYTGFLDKALNGDDAALAELLQFDAGQDSLALAGHGQVVKSLLEKLGDELFAQKISLQSQEVKERIWAVLEMTGDASLKMEAPLTLKALMPKALPSEHRGLYVFNTPHSTYRNCAEPEARYLVVDETGGNMEKNYRRLLKFPYPNQPIYAAVIGYKTPYYGNQVLPRDFAGFFIVTEIQDLAMKNFRNTCIPYEIWALGTEPFWYAQVSEAEGVIEYRGMDDERTKFFTYQPPVQEDSLKIYSAVNQDTGDNIRIAVEKGTCSDGMSDNKYSMKVRLTMNGRELQGCGMPFEVGQDSSRMKGG